VNLPRVDKVGIDAGVLAFTLGISLVAGVLFGILPTLRAAGPSLEDAVRGGGRGTVGRSGTKLRSALVVAQVALAVVLIAGAGLTIKSFQRLLSVNLGFDPKNALTVNMSIPDRYETADARLAYYENILSTIRRLPGVVAVGAERDLPTRGNGEGRRPDGVGSVIPAGEGPQVAMHHISSDYFKAMGIPLKGGRTFDANDKAGSPIVLIVNEELARRYWPGQDAVGKHLKFGEQEVPIVGVVGNIRQNGPADAVEPTMYIHVHQQTRSRMSIVIRTSTDPNSLINSVRQAIWSVDRDQTITGISTLEEVVGSAVSRPRLLASLLALFGILGLTLGALGIYGVLAFTVTQRRQEIGVRVALGAPPKSVLALVVVQGMTLAIAGIILGMVGSFAMAGSLQAVLYDIPATDLVTLAEVGAVLLGTALIASWIPAQRALAIDPAIALRYD
jgi:predicted permease